MLHVRSRLHLRRRRRHRPFYHSPVQPVPTSGHFLVVKPSPGCSGVKNLGERGGPGKLCSYWENKIYVVEGQVSDNPVYVVHPEGDDKGRLRTLHRYFLLLINELPVQFLQLPVKSTLQ